MSEAAPTAPESEAAPAAKHGLFRAISASPFGGIAPWVLMSIVSGPGRFEIAVLLALALSLLVFFSGRTSGSSVKLMEIFDLLFFIAFAIVGIFATAAMSSWLENWAGEITNVALVLFVLITLAIKQPFTLQYAKESTDPKFWNTPVFMRINYTITWVWAGAFIWQSLMGFIGDAVLHNSNNFWTGWILQIAAMIFAIAFTEYWPDYSRSKGRGLPPPHPLALWVWVPTFVIVTGVAGLLTDGTSATISIGCIIVGAIAASWFAKVIKAYNEAHGRNK